MKVLSFGTDRKLFENNSSVSERQIEYGKIFDELHIIVFTLRGQGLSKVQLAANVWVYPTGSSSKISGIFDAVRLGKKIFKERGMRKESTVISCQDPFEIGLVGFLLKKALKIPLQIQVHIDFFSPFYRRESLRFRMQAWLAPFILRQADLIRVVSEKIRAYLIHSLGIDQNKISVLPVYVPVEKLRNTEPDFDLHGKYPQFKQVLLVMSRLVKQKNIPLALCALENLRKKYPAAGLVIVGSGSEESTLHAMVKEKKLEEAVVFEPWASDVASYLKTADIFLMPSNYEGWGMAAVESSACGTPVVMTDVGCAGEFVISGKNGLIVPVGGCERLSDAVSQLLADPEKRKEMGQQGIESAAELPSKEGYLKAYGRSLRVE